MFRMPANVITALQAISRYHFQDLSQFSDSYKIGINSVGSRFEEYIKDLLTGKVYSSSLDRKKAYNEEYAWLGNPNFPPDAIAKSGDAFEIKKHERSASVIPLNSSPPRDMLYSDDSKITNGCKASLGYKWDMLDLFYIVGTVYGTKVKSIYFVQGRCYAASRHIYAKIAEKVSESMNNSGLEYSKTSELGRVNRADPLGRASLRIRGMWQMVDPSRAFYDVAPLNPEKDFIAYAIMEEKKYNSFGIVPDGVFVRNAEIQDPNNPAKAMQAKVLEVSW